MARRIKARGELFDPSTATGIKGIEQAQLPAPYRKAEKALADLKTTDEVKQWSDKAAAFAAYARMSKDKTLLNLAKFNMDISKRRLNDMLKEMKEDKGGKPRSGAPRLRTRRTEEDRLGLSENDRKQVRNIGKVPDEVFDELVNDANPNIPTPTALAKIGANGSKKAPAPSRRGPEDDERKRVDPTHPKRDESKMATKLFNLLEVGVRDKKGIRPGFAAKGMTPEERVECAKRASDLSSFLDVVMVAMNGKLQ